MVGDLSDVAAVLGAQIENDRNAGLEQLSEFVRSMRGLGLTGVVDIMSFKALLNPLGEDVALTIETTPAGWVDSNTPTEGNDLLRGTEFDDVIDGRGCGGYRESRSRGGSREPSWNTAKSPHGP